MLEQAKRPEHKPTARVGEDQEYPSRRPAEREDALAPSLEAPPGGSQSFSEEKTPPRAEAQANVLGATIAEDLPRGLRLSDGELPSAVSEVAERHLGVPIGAAKVSLGTSGQQTAKQAGAIAVAEGDTVSIAAGQLSTDTPEQRHVLGHELTHVGQQAAHGRSAPQKLEGEGGGGGTPTGFTGGESGGKLPLPATKEARVAALRVLLGSKVKKVKAGPAGKGGVPTPDKPPGETKPAEAKPGADPGAQPETNPTGSEYGFTALDVWNSFSPSEAQQVAKDHPDLWEASKDLSGMDQLSTVTTLASKFGADVRGLADSNLSKSEQLARLELERLGGSSDKEGEPSDEEREDHRERLGELKNAVTLLKSLNASRAKLREVEVYTGAADGGWVKFDPDQRQDDYLAPEAESQLLAEQKESSPPQAAASAEPLEVSDLPDIGLPYVISDDGPAATIPPNPVSELPEEPTREPAPEVDIGDVSHGGRYNWSTVNELWERVQGNEDQINYVSPAAFTLSMHGQVDEFLGASDEDALVVVADSIGETLAAIQKTRRSIADGTLSWSDFEAVEALLLEGVVPGASGTRWSDPVPEFSAELAIEKERAAVADVVVDLASLSRADVGPEYEVLKAQRELDSKGDSLEAAKRATMNPLLRLTQRGRKDLEAQRDEAGGEWVLGRLLPPLQSARDIGRALDELWNSDESATEGVRGARKLFKGAPKKKKPRANDAKLSKQLKETRDDIRDSLTGMDDDARFAYLKTFPTHLRGELNDLLLGLRKVGNSVVEFRAHHLIPVELSSSQLVLVASRLRSPWRLHGRSNSIPLPTVASSGGRLVVHAGAKGHSHIEYNKLMETEVMVATAKLEKRAGKQNKSLRAWARTTEGADEVRKEMSRLEGDARELLYEFARKKKTL